ncbi:MAG: serine/threonine protein kinase [Planctomycetota bacterium]|jgi:serine/threonine protein kinase
MNEKSEEDKMDLDRSEPGLIDIGLAAAFGGAGSGSTNDSVIQMLRQRTHSALDLELDSPESSDPPIKVTEEAKQLRDPSGRYQVLGEIGRGGVGVVYKGRDQDLGRDVAMKVLKDEYAERPDVLARFVEEAQIGGQLQHPGLVPVYEVGLQNGQRPYFAMKLVKGETLAAQLARRSDPASERSRFIGMFEQICQTLAYTHSRRVVHRDLKPANVMIGAFGEVQVVDWGFAKVLTRSNEDEERAHQQADDGHSLSVIETLRSSADSGSGSASIPGSLLGTPAYMSPEQALGDLERVDERADVFGLGAILCEILTGSAPYTKDEGDLIDQARYARLDPARSRLAACDADAALVDLCLECLAPERNQRLRSGTELAKRISAYLALTDGRARSAEIRAGQWRTGLFASIIGAVVIILGLGMWAKSVSAAEQETRRELARASEIKGLMIDMLSSVSPEQGGTADLALLKGVLATAAERLKSGAIEDGIVAAELQTVVGRIYLEIGDEKNSEMHLLKAIGICREELEPDDPAFLGTAFQLARLYGNTGRMADSEKLLLSIVEERTKDLGSLAEDTLEARIALVRCHLTQGRIDVLEGEAMKVAGDARAGLGNDSVLTLDAIFLLAAAKMSIGRMAEAGELLEEVCEGYRTLPGQASPRMPTALVQLAGIRAREGQAKEAKELAYEGLAIADHVFGIHNSRRLNIASGVAGVLFFLGCYADAEIASAQALLDYRGYAGSERLAPPGPQLSYGVCLLVQRKYQQAHELFEPLLVELSASEDALEPDLRKCMSGLIGACQGLGLDEQSRTIRRRLQPLQLVAAAIPSAGPAVRHRAASSLLAPEDPQLHDPVRAQALLEQACVQEESVGRSRLWWFLSTLAKAQSLAGDSVAALATSRRALAAIPESADELIRDLIRSDIEKYAR